MRTAKRGGRATGFLDLLLYRLSFRAKSSTEVSRKSFHVKAGGCACSVLPGREESRLTCSAPVTWAHGEPTQLSEPQRERCVRLRD